MKKICVVILFYFCFSGEILAQIDSVLIGTLHAYIVPLPLLDQNPRLRLGMEYHSSDHIGYNLEVGLGNSNLNRGKLKNTIWGRQYSFF